MSEEYPSDSERELARIIRCDRANRHLPQNDSIGYQHAGARNYSDYQARPDPSVRDSFALGATPGDALLNDLHTGPFHM